MPVSLETSSAAASARGLLDTAINCVRFEISKFLTDGENLISFCTLAKMDDVQPTSLTPWIGWVYTFPQFRGKRMCEKLLSHAESVAKQDGAEYTYISTNHIGLYEKFGYEFLSEMTVTTNL